MANGVGTYSINSFWESGSLIFYEKAVGHTATGDVFTLGTAAVKIGGTAQDVDFQFYATGSKSAIIDAGAATFTLVGIATATNGAVTITNATATSSTTTGALIVTGGIATAADITCGDDLFMGSGGVINFNSGDVTITHSSGALAVAATWATPAATGRPFGVNLTVNAALGSYSNALKGNVVYGVSGYTAGLGSAVNCEITLSAGTVQGNYAPVESEVTMGTGASTGTATGFMYCNSTGTGSTAFESNGHLVIIGSDIASTADGFWEDGTVGTPANTNEFVSILTPSGRRWIGLYDAIPSS